MSRNKYILFALLLSLSAGAFAQKAERDYIRKGNRLFKDSVFVDAEVNYRKALEANPKSTISMYNLGNTLSQQQKFKDAMEQYVAATSIEKDKAKLGQIYHNMDKCRRGKMVMSRRRMHQKDAIILAGLLGGVLLLLFSPLWGPMIWRDRKSVV